MNQDKFQKFSEAYRMGLQEAVAKDPEKYWTKGATAEEYAKVVSARMLESIGGGKHFQVNYEGGGFRRACKTVGIKHTRKAILAYLEIE